MNQQDREFTYEKIKTFTKSVPTVSANIIRRHFHIPYSKTLGFISRLENERFIESRGGGYVYTSLHFVDLMQNFTPEIFEKVNAVYDQDTVRKMARWRQRLYPSLPSDFWVDLEAGAMLYMLELTAKCSLRKPEVYANTEILKHFLYKSLKYHFLSLAIKEVSRNTVSMEYGDNESESYLNLEETSSYQELEDWVGRSGAGKREFAYGINYSSDYEEMQIQKDI